MRDFSTDEDDPWRETRSRLRLRGRTHSHVRDCRSHAAHSKVCTRHTDRALEHAGDVQLNMVGEHTTGWGSSTRTAMSMLADSVQADFDALDHKFWCSSYGRSNSNGVNHRIYCGAKPSTTGVRAAYTADAQGHCCQPPALVQFLRVYSRQSSCSVTLCHAARSNHSGLCSKSPANSFSFRQHVHAQRERAVNRNCLKVTRRGNKACDQIGNGWMLW